MRQARPLAAAMALVLSDVAQTAPVPAQDAAAGKKLFQTYCSVCHTVQPERNLIGPSLFGVVGRPSGQVPGFRD